MYTHAYQNITRTLAFISPIIIKNPEAQQKKGVSEKTIFIHVLQRANRNTQTKKSNYYKKLEYFYEGREEFPSIMSSSTKNTRLARKNIFKQLIILCIVFPMNMVEGGLLKNTRNFLGLVQQRALKKALKSKSTCYEFHQQL